MPEASPQLAMDIASCFQEGRLEVRDVPIMGLRYEGLGFRV